MRQFSSFLLAATLEIVGIPGSWLIVERADVKASSKDKNSLLPLSWAAKRGNEIMVKLLIEGV